MDVLKKIEQDFNQAFKNKDELVVLVLRQIKTALTNAEIAKNREALSEQEIIKILRSEIKKRKEAIELYQKGGRPELAAKETKEIEIVSQYLPPALSEEQIRAKIQEVIAQSKASSQKDADRKSVV